jgi:GNAT superfamily N-acetyltransferase
MIRFERAVQADAEALTQIQIRAFAEDLIQYGIGPEGYNAVAWQQREIEHNAYWKMLAGDQLIGGMVVYEKGKGECYLCRIFVDPEFQQQGVGSQALAFLEATYSAQRWTVDTAAWSYRNQHFYEQNGYQQIGEHHPEGQHLPSGFTLFLYEKKLVKP